MNARQSQVGRRAGARSLPMHSFESNRVGLLRILVSIPPHSSYNRKARQAFLVRDLGMAASGLSEIHQKIATNSRCEPPTFKGLQLYEMLLILIFKIYYFMYDDSVGTSESSS